MSYTIILKKNGIVQTKEWVYDKQKDTGSYVYKDVEPKQILRFLQHRIEEIEDGYTLRDYFRMITEYDSLVLLDGFFPYFLEEYTLCPEEGCLLPEISNLVLQRIITVEHDKNGDIISFDNYINFNGENPKEGECPWAIEFTPLREILDTPIKINPTTIYIDLLEQYKSMDSQKYQGKEDLMPFFDFIIGVIYELSFLGTPETRDIEKSKIDEEYEDIENGTAELIPFNIEDWIKK